MDRADAQLLILDGRAAGRVLDFRERVQIGSAPDCDLVLDEVGVHPVHATIEPSGAGYRMRAPAGVFIDGAPASDVELPSIAKVVLGTVGLIFQKQGGGYVSKPTVHSAPVNPIAFDPRAAVYKVGDLVRPRSYAALALLDEDHVLLAGGSPPMRGPAFATAEIFSIAQGTGREIPLTTARTSAAVSRLHDGRILLAGGNTNTAEIFDPQTQTFRAIAPMAAQRTNATATTLANGLVVVMGGLFKPGPVVAEVYDPARGTWGGLRSPEFGTAQVAPLDGQRFLVAATVGGMAPRPPAVFHVFDSKTWRFEPIAPPSTPRWSPDLVALGEGRVLVLCGHPSAHVRTVECFDLATRQFHPMADMLALRSTPAITRLANGRVLVVGGASLGQGVYSAEVFDPATNTWSALPAIWHGINPIGGLARADGSALIAGFGAVSIARDAPWGP